MWYNFLRNNEVAEGYQLTNRQVLNAGMILSWVSFSTGFLDGTNKQPQLQHTGTHCLSTRLVCGLDTLFWDTNTPGKPILTLKIS